MQYPKHQIKLTPYQFRNLKIDCYERDGFRCQLCRRRYGTSNLHPHHIYPKGRLRLDVIENLLTVCTECHRLLHDGLLDVTIDDLIYEHMDRIRRYLP